VKKAVVVDVDAFEWKQAIVVECLLVTRGSGLNKLGLWLVWRRVGVPHSASGTTLVCRFIAHKLCCSVLGNISLGFGGVGGTSPRWLGIS